MGFAQRKLPENPCLQFVPLLLKFRELPMRKAWRQTIPAAIALDDAVFKELLTPQPWRVFAQSLIHLSAYGLLAYLGSQMNLWWTWLIIWWFQGAILTGFSAAAHECLHGNFIKSPRIDRIAGIFWATLTGFNFSLYKSYHLQHHQFTRVPGDTEEGGNFDHAWEYLSELPIFFGLMGYFAILSMRSWFGEFPGFVRSANARRAVQIDGIIQFTWFLAVVLLACWQPMFVLYFYLCPLIIHFCMVYWVSLPEHYGCEMSANPLANTRTISSNFLVRFFYWNANYHAEHHAFPSVPSYHLGRLHQLVGQHFQFQERSYLLFHLKVLRDLIQRQSKRANLSENS